MPYFIGKPTGRAPKRGALPAASYHKFMIVCATVSANNPPHRQRPDKTVTVGVAVALVTASA